MADDGGKPVFLFIVEVLSLAFGMELVVSIVTSELVCKLSLFRLLSVMLSLIARRVL